MTKKLEPPPADFDENPEWTEADFARTKPFKAGFPERYAAWKQNKGGRPPVEQPKVHIGFRLAADVVEGVRASGKGYNTRVEKVLREALQRAIYDLLNVGSSAAPTMSNRVALSPAALNLRAYATSAPIKHFVAVAGNRASIRSAKTFDIQARRYLFSQSSVRCHASLAAASS